MKKCDLKPGDILLFPPTSSLGDIIVKLTDGSVSHAAIYCGDVDGQSTAADASLGIGISTVGMDELCKGSKAYYVMRHKLYEDLCPIGGIALTYADGEHPYANLDLGLLGILLLANRFLKKTIFTRIFYRMLVLIALKLIKSVNERRHPGKSPMTCSQFAAQCYTDAGLRYEIAFEKLFIQFGSFENESPSLDDLSEVSDLSCLDILASGDATMLGSRSVDDPDAFLKDETGIVQAFKNLLDNHSGQEEPASVDEIRFAGKLLLGALCKAFTNEFPGSVKEGIGVLATNRNHFVTPEDLLSHTKNLNRVAYITL